MSERPKLTPRLLGGGTWALIGKGGALGLNFIAMALVTRVLDPTAAGAYLLAQVMVNAAALLSRLGLENTVIFLVSSATGSGQGARAVGAVRRVLVLGAASATCVAIALSAGGASFIGEHVFRSRLVASVGPLLGPWTAAVAMQVLLSESFRGFHRIREATLFGGVVSGLLNVAGLAALGLSAGTKISLDAAIWTAVLSVAVSATAAGITLTITQRNPDGAHAASHLAPTAILRQSLPVLVSNLTAFVILNVDVWVVGSALPERTVATYAAAARMVTLIALAAVVANQVLPPFIGELYARGERDLMQRLLRATAFVVGVPALLAAAVFVFAGPFVLRVAFGPAYEAGATVLAILAVGQVGVALTGSTAYTLIMTGHQVASMWLAAGAAAAAAVACFAVVHLFGTTGVAAAIPSVIVVQQIVTLVAARRLVGVWTHASPTATIAELRKFLERRA